MLRIKAELFCDVCGRYPDGVQYHHPSQSWFTWTQVNASGAIVLPEGWVSGAWDSTQTYCGVVCKARVDEVAELKAKKATAVGSTDSVHCNGCAKTQYRLANYLHPRYVLPPGWVEDPDVVLYCGACMAKPEIQKRHQAAMDKARQIKETVEKQRSQQR